MQHCHYTNWFLIIVMYHTYLGKKLSLPLKLKKVIKYRHSEEISQIIKISV